jgi:hypothetical protein
MPTQGYANNLRIASNLNLDNVILELFQEHLNPFILSELDYKIQNINSLANDLTITPIERASNAMKKFSRLSDSEIVTPEIVTDKIINAFPANANQILERRNKIKQETIKKRKQNYIKSQSPRLEIILRLLIKIKKIN